MIDGLMPIAIATTLVGALATARASARTSRLVALAFCAPALAITSVLFWQAGIGGGGGYIDHVKWAWIPAINANLEFGVDGLSASLAWLTALLTPLVILYSWNEAHKPKMFYSLILLLNASVMGVFSALDLLLFYVFWEFVLIPMYFLIAVWGGPNRKYASTKFFVYTGAASLVMLVGFMAVAFAAGGTWSIPTIVAQFQHAALAADFAAIAFGLLALGFLVKMPSAPFHTWLPDAHVQAPTAGSVLLAGVLLKMGSYGLMRIAIPMFGDAFTLMHTVDLGLFAFGWSYQWLFFVLGTVSVLYGAFLCLAQDDMKSLIAYSSVSHMGMITIALATMTPLGLAGAAYMNIAHGVISAGMFMAAGSLQHATGTRLVSRLGGVGATVPKLTGLTATLFLASLGLPGLMGFIAEFTIFAGVWQAFGWWILLPIWSILVTAGYYLWALQRAFYGPERRHPDVDWHHIHDVPRTEQWAMVALILLALLFGILPGLLMGQMNDWTLGLLAFLGGT
ncbi:MAG: dehydrogenase subunit [Thermoplasmata archaeon]|jgi:NADH-quinone oxidoreductase subunit M|nr:dehydrogenase subunit [Thermoplasmata archaeon]